MKKLTAILVSSLLFSVSCAYADNNNGNNMKYCPSPIDVCKSNSLYINGFNISLLPGKSKPSGDEQSCPLKMIGAWITRNGKINCNYYIQDSTTYLALISTKTIDTSALSEKVMNSYGFTKDSSGNWDCGDHNSTIPVDRTACRLPL